MDKPRWLCVLSGSREHTPLRVMELSTWIATSNESQRHPTPMTAEASHLRSKGPTAAVQASLRINDRYHQSLKRRTNDHLSG